MLGKVIEDKPLASGEGIIHQKEGLELLPANFDLAAMEVTLVNIMSRETVLREYLDTVRDQYDVILLDCCPSLGMLTINAMSAADEVLIPMQAHFLSLKGMEQIMNTIGRVKRQINPTLTTSGILTTMADMRTTYSQGIVELLRGTYGDQLRIFDTIFPRSIRAQ